MIPGTIIWFILTFGCLLIFLTLSAFFSGSETAFFSLNTLERERLKSTEGKSKKKFLDFFFSEPDSLLATVLTGNMIVNVFATDFFASTVTAYVSTQFPYIDSEVFSILVITPLLILTGEMTPKNIVVRHPLAFARLFIHPLRFFYTIFLPITGLLDVIRSKILKSVAVTKQEKIDHDTLIALAMKVGYKRGMISDYELDMLDSYLELKNKTAYDVMIPRNEISGIEISYDIETLFREMTKKNSRIISGLFIYVYKNDLDYLSGYIHIKDLLPVKYGLAKKLPLENMVHPFYTVPYLKNLYDLTTELKEQNCEVALVIDEYGGVAGIVTFQDIVQDLLDHFYTEDRDAILEICPGQFALPGNIEIEALEDLLDMQFETESRTVSGMILEYIGEIPQQGDSVTIAGIGFTVMKVAKTKILRLVVKRMDTE